MARTSAPPLPFRPDEGHGARNRGESLIVVANPRAGGGRAGARRAEIEHAVTRAFERGQVWWTERPGHATELARRAAGEADIVAALGGDGTCHEVVNGLLVGRAAVHPRVIFAVIPFGTGGDLVRSLEIKGGIDGALWIASTGMTLHLDAGLVEWPEGRTEAFINVAGFGANAEVCRLANQSTKRFGGTATFLSSILQTLVTYSPVPVRWRWDGPDGSGEREIETLSGFCANGHYCGAGLWVGKGGSMADGVFELTVVPKLSAVRAARYLPRLYSGQLDGVDGILRVRAHTVEVASPVPMELEGEPVGTAPARLSVLPGVLQVRGGWLQPPVGPA